mmetsp:Transcript_34056/g.89425  ORF Transcript_34056/g.89425 Transcript_34056/m.89425 type:complete len:213 (-) Transcript_34056:1363-2001(-)
MVADEAAVRGRGLRSTLLVKESLCVCATGRAGVIGGSATSAPRPSGRSSVLRCGVSVWMLLGETGGNTRGAVASSRRCEYFRNARWITVAASVLYRSCMSRCCSVCWRECLARNSVTSADRSFASGLFSRTAVAGRIQLPYTGGGGRTSVLVDEASTSRLWDVIDGGCWLPRDKALTVSASSFRSRRHSRTRACARLTAWRCASTRRRSASR